MKRKAFKRRECSERISFAHESKMCNITTPLERRIAATAATDSTMTVNGNTDNLDYIDEIDEFSSEEEEEYEVEAIVAHRKKRGKKGTLEYFIKWKGWPDSDNTWESEDNVHAPDLVAEYWADKGGPIGREEARLNKRELALRQKARDKAASQSSQTIKKSEPVKPTATKEKETSATPAEKSETVEQAKAKGPAKEPAKEPTKEPTKESSNEPTNEPAKVTESQTSGTQEPGVKRFRITPKKPRIASASPSPEVQSSETYNKRPLADTDEIDSARNASKRARAVSPEIPDSPTSISQSPQRDAVETTMIFEKRPFPEPKREREKESLKVAEQSKDDVAQVEKTTVPEQEREPRPAIEAAVPSNEQILEASVDEAMTGAAEKPSETEIAERNLHENETVSRLKDDSANLLNVTDGLAEETNELMDIDVPLETVEECLNERSKQDQTLPETTESTTEPTTDNIQSKNQPEQTEEQQMDILGDIENIQPASDNENLSDAAAAVREQTAKVPPINGDTALNVVDQMEVSRDAITEGAQTSSQMFNDYVESAKESQKITIKKKITELTPKDVIYDESFPYDPTDWDTKIVAIEAIVRRPDLERSNNLYAVVLWKGGKRSLHENEVVRNKCPQLLLDFYEGRLKFSS